EAAQATGEAARLAVVAPAHRLAADHRQQGGDLALLDALRHLAAVCRGGANTRLFFALRLVGLHAVTVLPGGEVAEGNVVEEMLVCRYTVRCHVDDLHVADLRQALERSARDWICGQAKTLNQRSPL